MRAFNAIILVVLVGCAAPKRGDLLDDRFTFIGIPRALSEETYLNVHGLMRGLYVDVVRVTKGSFDEPKIELPIAADQPAYLKFGVKYLITVGYGDHGLLVLDYHEFK